MIADFAAPFARRRMPPQLPGIDIADGPAGDGWSEVNSIPLNEDGTHQKAARA